jgi:hypothetical protein
MQSDFSSTTRFFIATAGLALVVAAAACGDSYDSGPSGPVFPPSTLFAASGDISATLTEYRTALGASNGGTPGPLAGGRREINWDGVPGIRTNTNDFPGDFFNTNAPRGTIFSAVGGGFRVSDNDFADVDATYDAQFEDFSPAKTFMPVGTNIMDVTFRIVADTQVATVKAFAIVFSDVDRTGSTVLEFYDKANALIGRVEAPARTDAKGASFAGLLFESPIVARVRIRSGDAALGAAKDVTDGGTADLVIMDDYILSEPVKN